MATTSKFDLIDRLLDGRLPGMLAGWRAEGLTYEAIARKLDAEHDITVATATVYRWCADLAPSEPAA